MNSAIQLGQWLYRTLSAGLGISIFSHLPERHPLPCLHIMEISPRPWLIKPVSEEVIVTMQIYSGETSNHEALRLASMVRDILAQERPSEALKVQIGGIYACQKQGGWSAKIEVNFYVNIGG